MLCLIICSSDSMNLVVHSAFPILRSHVKRLFIRNDGCMHPSEMQVAHKEPSCQARESSRWLPGRLQPSGGALSLRPVKGCQHCWLRPALGP